MFTLISLISLTILIFVFNYKSIKKHISIVSHIRKLPGPPSKNFLIGNVAPVLTTPENLYKLGRKWNLEYYPIYQCSAAHFAVVNVMSPYDLETILSNPKHNTKAGFFEHLHRWLGTGLLTSDGSKWHQRRKILTRAFHFNILQEFVDIFNEETESLVETFKKECHKPHVAVTKFISDFALDTIGKTAMGISFGADTSKLETYKQAIQEMGNLFLYRLCRPWFDSKLVYFFHPHYHREKKVVKVLHSFTTDVIQEREKSFNLDQSADRKRLALLDLLLTAKSEGSVDDEGIREEVDTFMFEGHDTTSVAICYTLMLIACNPKIQDRVCEEMEQVLPKSTKPDYNSLQGLKYMEMCIKETLRLYPSVAMIGRVLGEDIVTESGHLLKTGSNVFIHICDIHRNPNIYPDPEKFDPDRFSPENCQKRHPFAYVPFSAGPRNCIGQKFAMLEIKSVLCGVLSEFVLEPVDTPSTIVHIPDFVTRTKSSIRIKFIPRTTTK